MTVDFCGGIVMCPSSSGQATDVLESDELFTLSALKDASDIDAVFDVDLETAGMCHLMLG